MSPINYLSEDDLIDLLKKKDQRAFHYLYDNYAGALYGVVLRVVTNKNYADEVLQDTFVKIWTHGYQFDREKGRLYTWMLNIARNAGIDYIKSKRIRNDQKNQSLQDIVNSEEKLSFAETDLEEQLGHIGINSVIDKLKPDWRILIKMAYYEGYTQQEIAEELQIPLGTVKTRVRAALMQLKFVLKEYR
ncbi:RNA polymerase sigma-70 factor, ECF subfamily [Sphingobacterium nematocida]|uniref:RNA polymerase sigma-70 factor, ECF subfamily n=1 Tax=Sphingobacterium nematocida TaxID=1513896 RepID=A0A1T5AVI8_9SPHI|nr:sigma-70 family RNA polymerase sigma factor [Sphingobacterium nematocida]SKB38992.1 RNA polymerase sigma-70 factor, ECF subfamily [Sphingobacterium nematocida]